MSIVGGLTYSRLAESASRLRRAVPRARLIVNRKVDIHLYSWICYCLHCCTWAYRCMLNPFSSGHSSVSRTGFRYGHFSDWNSSTLPAACCVFCYSVVASAVSTLFSPSWIGGWLPGATGGRLDGRPGFRRVSARRTI